MMSYRSECMEKHREIAKELNNKSLNYKLNNAEKSKINKLRKERENKNIFLSMQHTDIAIEIINSEKFILHDLKNNKSYMSKWYQEIGMPIIAVFIPYIDVLYKSSLII